MTELFLFELDEDTERAVPKSYAQQQLQLQTGKDTSCSSLDSSSSSSESPLTTSTTSIATLSSSTVSSTTDNCTSLLKSGRNLRLALPGSPANVSSLSPLVFSPFLYCSSSNSNASNSDSIQLTSASTTDMTFVESFNGSLATAPIQHVFSRALSTEMSLYDDASDKMAAAVLMHSGFIKQERSSYGSTADPSLGVTGALARQRSLLHSLSVDLPHLDEFLQIDSIDKWRQRVEQTASSLEIGVDPYRWQEVEMRTWLRFVCGLNNVSDDFVESVCGDGLSLCTTSAERLQLIFGSEIANFIQTELDIWKCVFKFTHGLPYTPLWTDDAPSYPAVAHTSQQQLIHPHGNDRLSHLQNNDVISYTTPPTVLQASAATLHHSSSGVSGALRPQFLPTLPSVDNAFGRLTPSGGHNYSPTSSTSSDNFSSPLSGSWSVDGFATTVDTSELNSPGSDIGMPHQKFEDFLSPTSASATRGAIGAALAGGGGGLSVPTRRVGGPRGPSVSGKHAVHLWQFLRELLLQPESYHDCIRWLDQTKGIFKIEDSTRVAKLWGQRKNRPAMNYDKLSRSIRQYYKKQIIRKTNQSKRLVYQFYPQFI